MVGEKHTAKHETHEISDNNEQLSELAHDRHEAMRDELERAERAHSERASEKDVLNEAKQLAHESSEQTQDKPASPAERRRGVISKKQLSHTFDSQMSHAREHMSPSAQIFSRMIHTRAVEKISDAVGSTLARPNALLSGSIVAFLAITIVYFTAKHYGYQLSGFETIGAFIIGWLLGILYDYFAIMIRGKK